MFEFCKIKQPHYDAFTAYLSIYMDFRDHSL